MFKSIVFSQFYEIKENGKDPLKARSLSILMVFILIALSLLFIFLLVKDVSAMPDFGIKVGKIRAKTGGRIVAGLVLGAVYLLTYLGLGENLIKQYLLEFEQMDTATQLIESKKGTRYFVIPLVSLLALIIALAIYQS